MAMDGVAMTKLEEALEIKSLRRVISAYLNYATAAEEDVRRWERSYGKLRRAHKELLSYLPKKYEELRRCISVNSFFILNMLQAFEPPFDMTGSIDENHGKVIGHDKNSDIATTTADRDPSSVCLPGERLNSGQPYVPSESNLKSSMNIASVKENFSQPETTEKTEAAAFMSEKNEDIGRATSGYVRFQEVDNAQHMECHLVRDLNSVDDNSCIGRMSECDPAMEDVRSSDLQINLSNNNEVSIGINFQDPAFRLYVPPADVDKVRCIVRNIVRDWSQEGALEREQCYKPILEELDRFFPNRSQDKPPCCLVPGAGLARLACEISRLGFVSQGNEFSYYMLICSSFILNNTQAPLEWVIHPWIHSNCNMISIENQLRPVYFPDLHPGSAGITEGFSMCAGDFVEVYSHNGQKGMWDAVATCFFIDTAHNIVDYIEVIAKVLKPGGVWINMGPLLYHFADAVSHSDQEEMSVELSLEDVKRVAFQCGFKLQRERTIETTYTANPRSMMQNRYFAAFWSMTKDGGSLHD